MHPRLITNSNPISLPNIDPVTTDSTVIEVLVAQWSVDAMANIENNRNVESGQGRGNVGDST